MAIDIEKHIGFWREEAKEDIQVARENYENGRYRFAMFLANLALEKGLKALVVRATRDVPPRIHNLTVLAEKAGLALDEETMTFLSAMDHYQMAGRYFDSRDAVIGGAEAERNLVRTEEMIEWLTSQ